MEPFDGLPECLVSYEIEPSGETVRLAVTESHSWEVPEAVLAGGREGWPAILSGLKSLLETGRPLSVRMAPPADLVDAVRKVLAERPWLGKQGRG